MSNLVTKDLSMVFNVGTGNEVHALNNINFTLKSGELLAVLGPSGCGKTTLLNIIAGFNRPTSGAVYLGEEEIEGPVSFRLANVAAPLAGDFAAAATTLALLGCRRVRSFNDDDDDWSNAEPGETATSVRLGSDVLVNQLRLQLEEAESFAEKMKQSETLKQRVAQNFAAAA